jgi:hypothetical protein
MLIGYLLLTVLIMVLTTRLKGPGWTFAIPWMLSIAPMTLGIINYPFLYDDSGALTIFLGYAALAYMTGLLIAVLAGRRHESGAAIVPADEIRQAYFDQRSLVRILWFVGLAGVCLQIVDFLISGGAAVGDLAELRENVGAKEGASIFGQVSILLTWANLYCFLFALAYRPMMRPREFLWLVCSGLMFVVPGLLSAGRQAAFQIVVVILLTFLVPRLAQTAQQRRQGRVVLTGIAAAMSAYMAYIVSARSVLIGSTTKEDVIRSYTRFDFHPVLDKALDILGPGLRSVFVEAITYFTHSIGFLDRFMYINAPDRFHGALSFPFVYGQIGEPLIGGSVAAAYAYKVQMLDTSGLIGVGWSTAYSGMYLDFGYVGLGVLMVILGYATTAAWYAMKRTADFNAYALSIILLVVVAYLPTSFGFSDTNLLFLALFCILTRIIRRRKAVNDAIVSARRG